mmetsp:Transcript_40719/g.88690  ORF Transcript_40719/g.88690 Transcript_40719/m.88690 type:complete len:224 (-) Transcript_40719:798-1469(-)
MALFKCHVVLDSPNEWYGLSWDGSLSSGLSKRTSPWGEMRNRSNGFLRLLEQLRRAEAAGIFQNAPKLHSTIPKPPKVLQQPEGQQSFLRYAFDHRLGDVRPANVPIQNVGCQPFEVNTDASLASATNPLSNQLHQVVFFIQNPNLGAQQHAKSIKSKGHQKPPFFLDGVKTSSGDLVCQELGNIIKRRSAPANHLEKGELKLHLGRVGVGQIEAQLTHSLDK